MSQRDVQPRWLSKGEAVDSLYRNLVSLYVMHCEQSAESEKPSTSPGDASES
jgi:hypothetical protein